MGRGSQNLSNFDLKNTISNYTKMQMGDQSLGWHHLVTLCTIHPLGASYDLVVDETPNELMWVQALEGVPYIAPSIYWMSHNTQLWMNPKMSWFNYGWTPNEFDMCGGLIYSTLSIYLSIYPFFHSSIASLLWLTCGWTSNEFTWVPSLLGKLNSSPTYPTSF